MHKCTSSFFSLRRFSAMRSLVAVVGATGTGKSKLAVDLASRFNGEIINGDAMQMYRGLPIITNQIPIEERNGVPHHLISCVDLEEEPWRIGVFRRECLRLINDIHARGKLPVLVGGTHYYTQSVLFQDQLVAKEPVFSNDETKSCAAEEVDSAVKWPILDAEPEVVLQRLREVDPVMADRWHPKDTRKIRRSLEIFFQTGMPASRVYAEQKRQKQTPDGSVPGAGQLRFNSIILWVHSEKPALNERLHSRVDVMIDQGLMSEARRMWDYLREKEAQGVTVDQTRGVWVSIGFKELVPYFEALENGSKSENELETQRQTCVESIKTATRQYAGSQVKWIRNKLWTGLADAGMVNRLYLLDTTTVEKWAENVTEPSERLVEALLKEEPLPDPKSLSELARTTIESKEAQPELLDHSTAKSITCDICRRTMSNEEQWKIHVHGSAHKRAVKGLARKAARDAYLRARQESLEDDEEDVKTSPLELGSDTAHPQC
ncbi:tRNA dimethylallyltransferase [Aspergillus lucknowensis]|uniref:tRNA dimethylallyltransferase n=1 Tax=Aspergillus lucknowensis TaxID=176173 RepID=A0ABR4LEM4_9EURO